jgi:hypothetical protein
MWLGVCSTIRQIDPAFDLAVFVEEMRESIIPEVVRAFLVGDKAVLERRCVQHDCPAAPASVSV